MVETRNSVKYLQKIDFAQLPLKEKIEIKTLGRATPALTISQSCKTKEQTYMRKFNTDLYLKYKWLTGCTEQNALFCFPCVLFGGDSMWVKTGITDLKHLCEKIKKHEITAKHLKNVFDLGVLGTVNISTQICEAFKQEIVQHNENVRKNRDILSKMIDCVKFCGKFELDLGECDAEPSVFRGLLEFSGKLGDGLKIHFLNSSAFKGSLKAIMNELLDSIVGVCRDEICDEIKKAKFLSVMSDDVSDVSESTQQSIVFRYELEGVVYERFWGFFNPNSKQLAVSVCEQLMIVLGSDNDKLIAQTYDGGVAMNEENGGVQTIVKKMYKNAHFIHCYAHKLNLIMEKIASQNPDARIFFSSLIAISTFFSKSPARLTTLNNISKRVRDSNTKWNFDNRLVNTVFENKDILKECFETLQINKNVATVQEATGFLHILNDEDFNFWLKIFHEIMLRVDTLNNKLHQNTNSSSILKEIEEFTMAIDEIKNNLQSSVEVKQEFVPPSKRRIVENQNITSATEICDHVTFQTKQRFSFTKHLSAAKLFSPKMFKKNTNKFGFPFTEINESIDAYPFLNKERLATELTVLYERHEFRNISGIMKIYEIIRNTGISDSFVEVFTLLQIILTTPMITAEPERSFGTLRNVKAFLRNSKSHDRLSALAMLSIEKVMIENIPRFNERVIEKFVTHQKNRKMDFIYK